MTVIIVIIHIVNSNGNDFVGMLPTALTLFNSTYDTTTTTTNNNDNTTNDTNNNDNTNSK